MMKPNTTPILITTSSPFVSTGMIGSSDSSSINSSMLQLVSSLVGMVVSSVGEFVGTLVGDFVGELVGTEVGAFVGEAVVNLHAVPVHVHAPKQILLSMTIPTQSCPQLQLEFVGNSGNMEVHLTIKSSPGTGGSQESPDTPDSQHLTWYSLVFPPPLVANEYTGYIPLLQVIIHCMDSVIKTITNTITTLIVEKVHVIYFFQTSRS